MDWIGDQAEAAGAARGDLALYGQTQGLDDNSEALAVEVKSIRMKVNRRNAVGGTGIIAAGHEPAPARRAADWPGTRR